MPRAAFVAIACGLVPTACGRSTTDRALAGTGGGAAAGGAAGALAGEEDVDLGEPAWD